MSEHDTPDLSEDSGKPLILACFFGAAILLGIGIVILL